MTGASAETTSGFWEACARGGRVLLVSAAVSLLALASVTPLTWPRQAFFAALTVVFALGVHRGSASRRATLFLVLVSCFASLRYFIWRVDAVDAALRTSGDRPRVVDALLMLLLLGAEAYFLLGMGLGYFQTLLPLGRTPAPLPEDLELWPEVDLLITTLDEPLHVVKYTALAAVNLDWPAERLNVHVLDDGRREEIRGFCSEAGVGYMIRDDLEHAKAGNINQALKRLGAPFVALFDADQAPTRSFLQMTMGWLLRDAKLALVQTPHRQYSADPFERNLGQFKTLPGEGDLFYGVVQDGNDLWNAAYFCGSCAVLRRAALDEIGGIAVGTLAEDAHTSLRLQKRGWKTAYANLSQAAGLAPGLLRSHVRQRSRWARGMAQVLRKENPLFARGLTMPQRLCYFHASIYFLYALPRLICLLAPLLLLVLGRSALPGAWAAVLAYGAPHLLLLYVCAARIQGSHREPFWNEIYETVLSPYLVKPLLQGLFLPAEGSFRVTPKTAEVDRSFFDLRMGWPFLVLFGCTLWGLCCAVFRLLGGFDGSAWALPARRLHFQPMPPGVVWLNAGWALFNLVLLSVAIGVACEARQRRRSVRLAARLPATVLLQDGTALAGLTADLSSSGVLFRGDASGRAEDGEPVTLTLAALQGEIAFPATVVGVSGAELRLQFDALGPREEEQLAVALYSRADAWVASESHGVRLGFLSGLWRLVSLGMRGLRGLFGNAWSFRGGSIRSSLGLGALLLTLLAFGILGGIAAERSGATERTRALWTWVGAASPAHDQPSAEEDLPLRELWSADSAVLEYPVWSRAVAFRLPETQVVRTATLEMGYRLQAESRARSVYVDVALNGVSVGKLEQARVSGREVGSGLDAPQVRQVGLPAELLVHANTFQFRVMADTGEPCTPATCSGTEAVLSGGSVLRLTVLPLVSEHGNTEAVAPRSSLTGVGRTVYESRKQTALRLLDSPAVGMRLLVVLVSCLVLAAMLQGGLQRLARRRTEFWG